VASREASAVKTAERPPAAIKTHVASCGEPAAMESASSTVETSAARAAAMESAASAVASAALRKSGRREQTNRRRRNDRK